MDEKRRFAWKAAVSQMPGSSIGDFVNGRFRAVKVALDPRSLERSLRELGWVNEVKPLAGPFFVGLGGRAG